MRITRHEELAIEHVSHDPDIEKRVMLRRGDVPHLTHFARARLAPGQTTLAHSHTGLHEIFYVLAGSGAVNIDGASSPLTAGACLTIAPGETHEITNTGAADLVLLYFGVEE